MSGRLLVATDGRENAAGAFDVAATLAERDGLAVDVLTVVEPLAADAGFLVDFPHRSEIERARAEELLARVVERLDDVVDTTGWQVELEVGHPAATIARVAREFEATMIVLDVNHHDAAGNRIALEVIQLANVPVLTARNCPDKGCLRDIVVGLDFSESSRAAAQLALSLAGTGGDVRLAHIRPKLDFPAALLWNWDDSYRKEVERQFDCLEEELAVPEGLELRRFSLDGEPAAELMALAKEEAADVIVIGGSGYTFRDRVMIGSVAQRLIADATCSVLTTPPVPSKRSGVPTISLRTTKRRSLAAL